MMESILDSLAAEKLYPSGGTNLLDLEELSDGDFLTNVVSLNPVQLVRTVCLSFFTCLGSFVCLLSPACSSKSRCACCTKSCRLFRPEPDLRRGGVRYEFLTDIRVSCVLVNCFNSRRKANSFTGRVCARVRARLLKGPGGQVSRYSSSAPGI